MTEPQRKAHVIIHHINVENCTIMFTAPDYESVFAKFGRINHDYARDPIKAMIEVDPRYDFGEVHDYIKNYQP